MSRIFRDAGMPFALRVPSTSVASRGLSNTRQAACPEPEPEHGQQTPRIRLLIGIGPGLRIGIAYPAVYMTWNSFVSAPYCSVDIVRGAPA